MDWQVRLRLEKVCSQRDKIFEKLAQVKNCSRDLRKNLAAFLTEMPSEVQVNVGCDFYLHGEVEKDSPLYIDIGSGIIVVMQPLEALESTIERQYLLEGQGEYYTKKYRPIVFFSASLY
eukprot:jgi/Galph1/1039/GphlegSOOS_G5821.1